MKKKLTFWSLAAVVLLVSCSKKNNVKPPPAGIVIEGALYDTVRIGKQTWTSVNYHGNGGEYYNNDASYANYGKLYTETEAAAITLPIGWHLPTATDYNNLLIEMGAPTFANHPYVTWEGTSILDMLNAQSWGIGSAGQPNGFNAMPSGFFYSGAAHYGFNGIAGTADFLSSSIDAPTGDYLSLDLSAAGIHYSAAVSFQTPLATDRGSVRFVKDN